jgi:hypothetical protein
MVFPEKNGFSVVYNQILPSVGWDKKEALLKADDFWRKLPQEEKERRNQTAKHIWHKHKLWEAAKKEVETTEETEKPKLSK